MPQPHAYAADGVLGRLVGSLREKQRARVVGTAWLGDDNGHTRGGSCYVGRECLVAPFEARCVAHRYRGVIEV